MSAFLSELAKALVPLLAVMAASYFALKVYFRQREYELVKQRYLEQGVDLIASELATALGVVSHNYARCLQMCKSFRDAASNFDIKELDRGFLELDSSRFQQVANHRVGSLLQSQVVWEVFQSAMAFAASTNGIITKEYPEAMRLRLTTSLISKSHSDMGEEMADDLRELHDKGFKYALIARELHALGLMLEEQKLSIKAISEFPKRPEVQELIARLKSAFPEQTGGAQGPPAVSQETPIK